ncbi:DNA-directed RNA polymerase subunit alpha [Candidatus Roizmanbacteria bacterium]|nr:DNA-directed RNA polymerase subunit alpha [Candidatus Roizmanbacteria bacterium]
MLNPIFFTQKTEEGNYGKFVIEPLPQGFGQSMGHALRRTLLSSLKGVAVTNIKFNDSPHLFSVIPGVKESVLEIMLNLKQLKFNVKEGGPYKVGFEGKGAKKILAKDIEGEVKPVNEDLYIVEMTDDKAKLSFEAIVEVGVGYSTVEDREEKKTGYIPVDAFFSPIKKVNVKVEEARVGRKGNSDRLIIEVETDGSIKPADAIKEAAELLTKYFSYLLSGKDTQELKKQTSAADEKRDAIDKKLFEIIIDELNLPSRVINALLREKIETVADLVKTGKDKLTGMKGVGKKSIELIEEELKKMEIELK